MSDSKETMKAIQEIAKMTDRNDHNESAIAGAKLLNMANHKNIFEAIAVIHNAEGSMPNELVNYRYRKLKEMWAHAEKELSPEENDAFQSAY